MSAADFQTKDFQEATARRIFHVFRDLGHRRVLLADEVGLGKTFVARRVIELVREWHKEENDDFFKVVYICSNASIAGQNIEKLGVENRMKIDESRLSMQHLFITMANNRIRNGTGKGEMPESIIPLTPSTSFRMTGSSGNAKERALMFCLLRRMPALSGAEMELSAFMSFGVKNWENEKAEYEEKITLYAGEEYIRFMLGKLSERIPEDTLEKLRHLAEKGTRADRREKAGVVSSLRRAFALISIDMLDPDLVIMDEFQRFADLLGAGGEDDSEQSMLTGKFFDPKRENTKILLLSATPYKPYSTLEEINENGRDEHYREFLKVTYFLFAGKDETEAFRGKWEKFSSALKKTDVKELAPLVKAKDEAEDALYAVMCRSERFNSGIIRDYTRTRVEVLPADILSFAEGQKLLERLEERKKGVGKRLGNMPVEYVKSSPYLLSFMDKYELKKGIVRALKETRIPVRHSGELLLPASVINNYMPLPPGNGKLAFFHDIVFGSRREKKTHFLLWVPASHPYYRAGGIFESREAKRFSKFLLFSSWEMVPRMVSCMMSYYAELYTIGEIRKTSRGSGLRYTSGQTAGGAPKNRYGENRLRAGNPLEYPCRTLAGLYSPEEYFGAGLRDIRKSVSKKIRTLLKENESTRGLGRTGRGSAKNILALMKALDSSGEAAPEDVFRQKGDVEILADMAIASPAVCAYRQSGDAGDAEKAARAVVSVFNKPESAAIVDLLYSAGKQDDDYYENVLAYCAAGNLQAVLDEYAHMLQTDRTGDSLTEAVLVTSALKIDTEASLFNEEKRVSMRNHFAVPFIDKTVTDKAADRTANIRKAFNSPFRPFILSSTSIGQEGLDFHWYARKIVHWNLPSNPVDLEQREGRVNRYKCLALRRNVARLFGECFSWDGMFKAAEEKLKSGHSDMVPYWCLPVKDLDTKDREQLEYIERIVPLYPLSRDIGKYARLVDVLSLYRMTLGQPRQEELLNLLKGMKLGKEELEKLTINLSPFDKARGKK